MPKDTKAAFDPDEFTKTVADIRKKVGNIRDGERFQLAHKSGVSEHAIRKLQTPGLKPDLDTLQSLIAYYYPGMTLSPNGSLQKVKSVWLGQKTK